MINIWPEDGVTDVHNDKGWADSSSNLDFSYRFRASRCALTLLLIYVHKLNPSFSEKQPTSPSTFQDILPSHCIISADCSAGTYYHDQSDFKSVIRRIAEPATDSTPKNESQKQDEELKYSFRRSILQKPRVQKYVDGLKNMKPSKKDGSRNFE
jgi:hypothetical protein